MIHTKREFLIKGTHKLCSVQTKYFLAQCRIAEKRDVIIYSRRCKKKKKKIMLLTLAWLNSACSGRRDKTVRHGSCEIVLQHLSEKSWTKGKSMWKTKAICRRRRRRRLSWNCLLITFAFSTSCFRVIPVVSLVSSMIDHKLKHHIPLYSSSLYKNVCVCVCTPQVHEFTIICVRLYYYFLLLLLLLLGDCRLEYGDCDMNSVCVCARARAGWYSIILHSDGSSVHLSMSECQCWCAWW